MAGKLIVLDGLDGSGKTTQIQMLYDHLKTKGKKIRLVSFPDYDSPSSALVKMYLAGEFGKNASDVNAYAASAFYAVDRFASYKKNWEKDYLSGTIILCARYTTSNAIHQMEKTDKAQWDEFLDWLYDFEFNKLGLPRPDRVLFLDMPLQAAQTLLDKRYHGDENKRDIHERDLEYLLHCREAALYAAQKLNWKVVSCGENGDPLPKELILQTILNSIQEK